MFIRKGLLGFLGACSLLCASNAFSQELDKTVTGIPQGLLVRVASDGTQVVYKANNAASVDTADKALEVIKGNAVASNQVSDLQPALSELDRTTSKEAWYYYYGGYYGYNYWGYNYYYNYYGAAYYYYPYYYYPYGGYSWYYCRW